MTTLADLLANLDAVTDVRREDVPGLVAEVEALKARLYAHLTERAFPETNGSPRGASDRLLTVEQVADVLGVNVHWVYRQNSNGRLPFVVRLGAGTIRFSERGLQRFMERGG